MKKFVVAYLQAVTDGRGAVQFRLASKVLSVEPDECGASLEVVACQVAGEGFFDRKQGTWIMPGAILSLREVVPPMSRRIGK